MDYIKSFFPEYFEDEADLGNVDTEETPNNDDVGIADALKNGTFNTETGLWKYPALSDHTPKQMMDEDLVHHTQLRNKCSSFGHLDTDNGLKIYLLKPSHDSAGLIVNVDPNSIILKRNMNTLALLFFIHVNLPWNVLVTTENVQTTHAQ